MKIKLTTRTTRGLRDMLFQEMDDFRQGKSSVKRATTVINFSREIINAARLEMVTSALMLEAEKNGKTTLRLE